MPPKRKGPLQLVKRELDEIKKQVCHRMALACVFVTVVFEIHRVWH